MAVATVAMAVVTVPTAVATVATKADDDLKNFCASFDQLFKRLAAGIWSTARYLQ